MTTPVINYIPQFQLGNDSPAASYVLKAYEPGATTTAVTTYKSKSDGTGGTTFTLNSRGEPASGGAVFAPHYSESVDVWIFPTQAEADANDTTNAIQVVDASVINPFLITEETIQRVDSAVGSAADVITANLSTAPAALADPLMVRVEISHGTNTTTTPTFNLNSLGAKTIVRGNQNALVPGDIPEIADLQFSETHDTWVLLNPEKNYNQGVSPVMLSWMPAHSWEGLNVANNGTTPNTKIDIAAGKIADSTGGYILELTSGLTGQTNNTWAAGDDAGKWPDSGVTLSADTWYRIFVIGKSTDSTDCDIGFDDSATAANLMADAAVVAAGYDLYRRVGWFKTKSGNTQVLPWAQGGIGRRYDWDVMEDVPGSLTLSTSGANVTVAAPPYQEAILVYDVRTTTTGASYAYLYRTGATGAAPARGASTISVSSESGGATGSAAGIHQIRVNSSSKVTHRESANISSANLSTMGWLDDLETA